MSCKAQVRDCNKDVLVKRDSPLVPMEVCIPNGYIIDEVYDSADVNDDGLKDFIFSWRKKQMIDGDTVFVSIYRKTHRGSHALLKTFKNLFPINFKSYEMSYRVEDEKLASIFNRYNGVFPFRGLEITGGEIRITIVAAVGEGYRVHYRFDVSRRTWILMRVVKWSEVGDKVEEEEVAVPKEVQVIDAFNYLDYMY
jgi:hypothetical protein